MKVKLFLICLFFCISYRSVYSQHQTGKECLSCHSSFKLGGTVYSGFDGGNVSSNVFLQLIAQDGSSFTPERSNTAGNIFSVSASDGNYLIKLGETTSKTWHNIPSQARCNTCHIPGSNGTTEKTIAMPDFHTSIPVGNDCKNCHHFPASMSYANVKTRGTLNSAVQQKITQGSKVQIGSSSYTFNPTDYNMVSLRQDIFAPGYFSMFDVIIAVCKKNSIPVEYFWDESRKTHFITKIQNTTADFWYHFSYDAGSGNNSELNFRRANRWDEALWRSGVWIKVVTGEDLAAIKQQYLEEIERENVKGHVIPDIQISINPSKYQGNPSGSGRVTISKSFKDVLLTPHNLRAEGFQSPYSKPFKQGVVTSMDIPLSLKDQGKLDAVTGVFYNYFAGNYIDSYYVVELGFPGEGTVHSSGRQGIVYITENGSYNNLPNGADNKLHMTSDINVIHSPDFSYWRWIELGNPYYENQQPTIVEDYESISRGFNLHLPYPNPFDDELRISYNIFHPGYVSVKVINMAGKVEAILVDKITSTLGIETLKWRPAKLSSGVYIVKMTYKNQVQERIVVKAK